MNCDEIGAGINGGNAGTRLVAVRSRAYELGFDETLPWLLREPPHMITTEAMALIAGRQAYRTTPLTQMLGHRYPSHIEPARQGAEGLPVPAE